MISTVWFTIACLLFVHVNSSGPWKNLTDSELSTDTFAAYYKWRGPSTEPADFQDATKLTTSFSKHSPCRALTIRDNCFSHNPARAEILLRRTLDSRLLPTSLNLPAALYDLKDQVILLVGDSTVVSVYASLVCHLSQATNVSYDLMWMYEQEEVFSDEENQGRCPGHLSCHLIRGTSRIESHNITLVYQQLNSYHGKQRETFRQVLLGDNNAPQPTVVIMNLGMHYNDERKMMHEMFMLSGDMVRYFMQKRASNSRVAQWHWLETFPQHFPVAGYFVEDQAAQVHTTSVGALRCQAIQNKTSYYEEDWRNRVAENFLPDYKRSNRLISIAEALYDQWDAHVDYGDSFRAQKTATDCTHYCLGSGVFRYVLDQILTSVVTCLQGKCKENHFFDGYVEPKPQPKAKRPAQRCSRIPGAALNKPAVGARQSLGPRVKRDPNCT